MIIHSEQHSVNLKLRSVISLPSRLGMSVQLKVSKRPPQSSSTIRKAVEPDKAPTFAGARFEFSSYGIEWPLLVWTDCRSGLSTIPLRLISSRKLLAVTGWPLSV